MSPQDPRQLIRSIRQAAVSGNYDEVERLVAGVNPLETTLPVELEICLARGFRAAMSLDAAGLAKSLHNARAAAYSLGDGDSHARCLELEAIGANLVGDLHRTIQLLEQARRLDAAITTKERLRIRLGALLARTGRIRNASSILEAPEMAANYSATIAMIRLSVAIELRDPVQIRRHQRALQRLPESDQAQVRIVCHLARGFAHLFLQRADLAGKAFRQARYLNDRTLHSVDLDAEARLRQAEALLASGAQTGRALTETRTLISELDRIGQPLLAAEIWRVHAVTLRAAGEPVESDQAFAQVRSLTESADRGLVRHRALCDQVRALLEERAERPGGAELLQGLLDDARATCRAFDHPSFAWEVRVLQALTHAALGAEEALIGLHDCRVDLSGACERQEVSLYLRDLWGGWIDARIERARHQVRHALARDVEAMEDVVRGLRSEDVRAHLGRFAASLADRLGAERIAMVLEGPEAGTLELIAGHGLDGRAAADIARALLESGHLQRDVPALIRDTGDASDGLGRLLAPIVDAADARDATSLDRALAQRRTALAVAIAGAAEPVGIIYLDRRLRSDRSGFRVADLRAFAFVSNGLAAVSRLAATRAHRENRRLRDRLEGVSRKAGIVTRSPAMGRVIELIERTRDVELPVLITGESGTGKELVARAIHAEGSRADGPFIPVNCAAIPRDLLEAELFGYCRGAFTGAVREKRGLFVEAQGGTLFLDEIGEMPVDVQAKILRVLEDRTVVPLGRNAGLVVDFRVIAATNVELETAVKSGAFRRDLFYRLEGLRLALPPLRRRPDDLLLLVEHFTQNLRASQNLSGDVRFSAEAVAAIERYEWPGNVRELRNAVSTAVALRDRDTGLVPLTALPQRVQGAGSVASKLDLDLLERVQHAVEGMGFKAVMRRLETHLVSEALEREDGNQRAAARYLSLSESSLREKLSRACDGGDADAAGG